MKPTRPSTSWVAPGTGDTLERLRHYARTATSKRHLDRLIARHGSKALTNLRIIGEPLSNYSEARLGSVTVRKGKP